MSWNSTAQAHLAARLPITIHWLVWTTVKDLASGDPVSFGIWSGDDHQEITIDGDDRLFYGAQGGLDIPPIRYRAGTGIQTMELGLSVSPEAETIVRGYNTRFAPIDLHCALYDPADGSLLDIRRMFHGFIDGTPLVTPERNGQAKLTVRMVSQARKGTMTINAKKSDASQRERDPDDDFRQYGSLGTVASDPWGGNG